VLLRDQRRAVTLGVMLATFLAALDVMIIGTAMPSIVASLGGLALYSWVFSVYLLTSSVTIPIYGKLADLFGRKRVLLAGTALFLLGSCLCGLSRSMLQLIAARAVQGLGAGAVLPTSMTIIGDIYTLEERGKMQGVLSAVWGIAAVIGPALGALIVESVGWPWTFYINLPVGLVAMAMIGRYLKEVLHPRRRPIDYAGAASLTAAIVVLLLP
jgi:multidrug resistance protein